MSEYWNPDTVGEGARLGNGSMDSLDVVASVPIEMETHENIVEAQVEREIVSNDPYDPLGINEQKEPNPEDNQQSAESDFSNDAKKPLIDGPHEATDGNQKIEDVDIDELRGMYAVFCSFSNITVFIPFPTILGIWGIVLMVISSKNSVNNYKGCRLKTMQIDIFILSILYLVGAVLAVFDTIRLLVREITPNVAKDTVKSCLPIFCCFSISSWIVLRVLFTFVYTSFVVVGIFAFTEFLKTQEVAEEANGFEKSIYGHYTAYIIVSFIVSIITCFVLLVCGFMSVFHALDAICPGVGTSCFMICVMCMCITFCCCFCVLWWILAVWLDVNYRYRGIGRYYWY